MKLLITGGSGTLGKKITELAIERNYCVNILTRNKNLSSKNKNINFYYWDPTNEEIDLRCFSGVDSVINLAGSDVFNYWTSSYKKKILDSRVNSSNLILRTISERQIEIKSFISASGIAAYKNSKNKISNEDDSFITENSFINKVVLKWESEVLDFKKKLPNISFSILRIGLVLSNDGGLYKLTKNLSRFFLLSPLGDGNQWQSWVHVNDAAKIFIKCSENNSKGIFNVVSSKPVTQNELIMKIAKYNRSKIILPNIPKFIVRIFFGEMSELVLSSQNVISKRSNDFNLNFLDIDKALQDLSK
tara:strand:- start:18085 stop:18993 length:909 start_codon:yes stop_codon:yes gene_type:complete